MHFERANGCHNYRGIRGKPRGAALNVKELLGAHVGAESRLGHHDLTCGECSAIGNDGVVSVGDVCKWASVHKRRTTLECLQEIWLDGIAQQRSHGSSDFQIFCRDGFAVSSFGNHNATEARAKVGKI